MGEPGGVAFDAPGPFLALDADWTTREGGIILLLRNHIVHEFRGRNEDLLSMSQGSSEERAFHPPPNSGPKRESGR
jgi:hypothetical protein